ncbi:MAG: hypothetical protein Q9227_007475 [Pyrenula ochraceoflavens]
MPPSSGSPWGQHHVIGTNPFQAPQPAAVAEQGSSKKKRGKNASSRDKNAQKAAESARPAEVTMTPPSLRPQSFGGYLPSGFPTIGDQITQNHITSPVLEALGSMGAVPEDSAYRTDVWTQSVPIGKSPPNDLGGTSVSESPPSRMSDRAAPISTPPSSPPTRKARPVSYGGNVPSQKSRPSSHDKAHRYSHGAPFLAQPPPPHHPQAHFYGAPDIDLQLGGPLLTNSSEATATIVGLDTISSTVPNRSKIRNQRVALMRSYGRLDVVVVQKNELKPIGCIDGVKGDIVDAKFLTWRRGPDPFTELRPLVALVVHGQIIESDSSDSDGSSVALESEIPRPSQKIHISEKAQNILFDTRVEVYSLKTQEQVALLLTTQPKSATPNTFSSRPNVPPPSGDLRLDSSGNYLTVTSSESGEVFIYTAKNVGDGASFALLGKVWTTVKARDIRRYSSSSTSTSTSPSPADPSRGQPDPEQALVSLSSRWLAIVPPSSNGRTSLRAIIPSSLYSKKTCGIDSYTAPSKPTPSVTIDSPDADSLFNRVARGVAQEFVKGAGWLYDQGLQQWKNYRNQNATIAPVGVAPSLAAYSTSNAVSHFPPTHGFETQNGSVNQPELVSLVDLSKLSNVSHSRVSEPLDPIATFQPPGGCSFVSFSPTGLSLMTSTKKGDVQYVWDLMQVVNIRVSSIMSAQPSLADPDKAEFPSRVRQIAKFSRFTDSSIIDVVWTKPLGDRIAITSRNGTIHVHDLPYSAFMWPPLRRRAPRNPSPTTDASLTPIPGSDEPKESAGVFASAWKAAGRAQPILANLRGRAPSFHNTVSGFGANSLSFATGAGVKGGKALAAGVSRSVDTIDNFRHAGESRMKIHSLAREPRPGRVCWHLGDNEEPSLTVVDGNVLRTTRVFRSKLKGRKGQSSLLTSVIDVQAPFKLQAPSLDRLNSAALPARGNDADKPGYSYFSLSFPSPSTKPSKTKTPHPLSHAEIETNPPYQPFHSDHRVNLFAYTSASSTHLSNSSSLPSASVILGTNTSPPAASRSSTPAPPAPPGNTTWVFGQPISATRLNVRPTAVQDPGEQGAGGEVVYTEVKEEGGGGGEGEKLVVTTKRKKGARGGIGVGGEDGEEIFEEDMEVVDWAGERV